jgi:predicted nucleic acid-binding protein
MILVDTSVLIDFFKGTKNAEKAASLEAVLEKKITFRNRFLFFREILQGAALKKN